MEALLESLRIRPVEGADRLPTMYDLPSEYPEDSLDSTHPRHAYMLMETLPKTITIPRQSGDRKIGVKAMVINTFSAIELNIHYDKDNPHWHKRPDWFMVLGSQYDGSEMQSFLTWQETMRPFLAVEILSPSTAREDLGKRQHKQGEPPTKWEVYEKILKLPYYVIFNAKKNELKAYKLHGGKLCPMDCTDNRVAIAEIRAELRVWEGTISDQKGFWLRFYDEAGKMILLPKEQAEQERQEKERALAAVADERKQNERLQAALRKAGIDPDSI